MPWPSVESWMPAASKGPLRLSMSDAGGTAARRNFGTLPDEARSGPMRPLRDPLFLLLFATAAATAFFAVYVAM